MARQKPGNVGELRAAGYRVTTVKEEMRRNLIARIRKDRPLFSRWRTLSSLGRT